jgi:type IV pilus biogenesis protein CpaD/CtpE
MAKGKTTGYAHLLARIGGLVVAALLGACTYPEDARMDAVYRAAPSEVQMDLYFQSGSPSLAPGEAARLRQMLGSLVLRSDDDILITIPATGSEGLDQRRVSTARSAASGTPARIRIIARPGFSLAEPAPDAALVQVQRYGFVRVLCPASGTDFSDEIWNRDELGIGCNNALNRAAMAATARDLTDPERLGETASHSEIRAAQRYRSGEVVTETLEVIE